MAKTTSTKTARTETTEGKRSVPSTAQLTAARSLVQDTSVELEAAARQLRSAHSFNDADERQRRVSIATKRHTRARRDHDEAVAEFARLKAEASLR